MEILKGYVSDIEFAVPPTVTAATFTIKQGEISYTGTASVANNLAKVTVPYEIVLDGNNIEVTVDFSYDGNPFTLSEKYSIATPILPLHVIGNIIESTDESEQRAVESAVRHIIQAYTGQQFRLYTGDYQIDGIGEAVLRLPEQLITLTSINGDTHWVNITLIHKSKLYLVRKFTSGGSIKSDYDTYGYDYSGQYPFDGVIAAPGVWTSYLFNNYETYTVTGEWGWDKVPTGVQEAAKLLVNDYACGDNVYRDRFVNVATGPDWRLQFNAGAYSGTGNVRVDQLLEDYIIKRGWEII